MNTSYALIPDDALGEIEALYDQGRYVDAHGLATARHGPLTEWRGGVTACLLGGRLAGNLGGERLRRVLILRACRRVAADQGTSPDLRAHAALFHAYDIVRSLGPLALRRFLKRPTVQASVAAASSEPRADFLCLEAHIAAAYHDTETAESRWQAAHALAPTRPWTWCERASLLVASDRYEESLDAARESLRLQPWYRPAVQNVAVVLSLLARDEEAVALLRDALDPAVGGLQSYAVAGQLADILSELQRPAEVLLALDRAETLGVLQEDPWRRWVASRRSEALLQLGDLDGAADAAEPLVATSFFYQKAVERLRDPAHRAGRRFVHAVPFVRQHERTCAPATLAALSHFWGRPADHQAIAQEICYGGTFDHEERHWAETHGWVVREFRADWPSVVALIDAGIPFSLATTAINSGHLQAGIGYDARRGTLVIRDPYERNQHEALAEEFFQRYAFGGPRAMAMVPADDPDAVTRLRAITLPECALLDALYAMRRALRVHDRPAARWALDTCEGIDPAARVTQIARRELAYYDGDDLTVLDTVERLLALFPAEGLLRLEKLAVLRRLARPAEARAWLESCATDPSISEPNLWRELARELAADARQRPRAKLLLARSLFREPMEAEHLRLRAEIHRAEGDFAEAFALYRLAGATASVREDYWQEFFVTSRFLRETDGALTLLGARFQRLGDRSSQTARTLHWAHRERHEYARAAAVLAEALSRRPDDGDLKLFAAVSHSRDGEHGKAKELLEAARGKVAPNAYSQAAAEVAALEGDAPRAMAHYRELLDRNPLDAGTRREYLHLLAETDPRGPAAVKEHLDAAVARFPYSVALHEMRVTSLVDEPGRGTPEHVDATDALLAIQPTHVWALRERALGHSVHNDFAAALAVFTAAEELDPFLPPTHALRGRVLYEMGETQQAAVSLRRALTLDADLDSALVWLLRAAPHLPGKREALAFMHGELVRQPYVGNGILAYRAGAYPLLEETELQAQLDAILAARPDLWQAWSAVVWQHADAGRLDPAHAHARDAAERFPLLPRVWTDLAAIEKLRGDNPAEVAALERALRIRSANGEASRLLAAAHRRADRHAEAHQVLEQAIAAAPLDMGNLAALAEFLWTQDRAANGSKVLELLEQVVRREPGYLVGWDRLSSYAGALGSPDVLERALRALVVNRPGEARSWLHLATYLEGKAGPALAERLDALERALVLNPRLTDAYDLRAFLLHSAGRRDEALAACEPPPGVYPAGARPFVLEGRAAWLLAQRGDLDAARARMRALLAGHPDYEWGWRTLADWAEAAGDQKEELVCAEHLAFLSPHAAMPMGYLAAARLRAGQRTAAKQALQEAMRRDPRYLYASSTLLDVQIKDHDWKAAEETLAFITKHLPGAPALLCKVRLAVRHKEMDRAQTALAELARARPGENPAGRELQEGANLLWQAGWGGLAEKALAPAMANQEAFMLEAGALWVRTRAKLGKWWGTDKAVRSLADGGFAQRARFAYLGVLGEHKRWIRLLFFLRGMRRELRAHTRTWGQGGYALVNSQRYGDAARWLTDWRDRPDAEGWMLQNLVTALHKLSRHDAAREVNRGALALPADHTRPLHLAWVFVEEALTDGEEAMARATTLEAEAAPWWEKQEQPYRYLYALARQTLAVRQAGDLTGRRAAFRAAQETLRAERKPLARLVRLGNRAALRAERRARFRMAREAELWWPRVRWGMFTEPASQLGMYVFVFVWVLAVLALCTVLMAMLAATSPPPH